MFRPEQLARNLTNALRLQQGRPLSNAPARDRKIIAELESALRLVALIRIDCIPQEQVFCGDCRSDPTPAICSGCGDLLDESALLNEPVERSDYHAGNCELRAGGPCTCGLE